MITDLNISEAAIALLKQMIATPSVSRDEKAVADILESYMRQVFASEVHRSGNNLWSVAPQYDANRQTLLLNAHIDTVKPVESWTHDPFTPTEEDGRIFGLGANDDGASLIALLHVFAQLTQEEESLPYNLVFLASCEEEVSGKGGISSVLPQLPHIDVALVGEPTGMNPQVPGGVRVAVAEKGLMVLDGVAQGRSGHAARNEGFNALYLAIDAINKLRDYSFEKESDTLGPIKITTTVIQAGTVHNVIPDTCSFVVDVRTTDKYSNEEVARQLQELVAPVTLTPRSTRLQPSGIDRSHPLLKAIRDVVPDAELFGSPTLSDQALLSCPSIKMGPGDSARSHTADEYIERQEIINAISLYKDILKNLHLQ